MPSISGLSVWWSTPASPDRYFSQRDLERSDRYHRPVRRVAVVATIAKVGLLLGGCWLAGGPLQQLGRPIGDGGVSSAALLTGAALTTISLRLPAVAADAWFEYSFRHGDRLVRESIDEGQPDRTAHAGFIPAPVARFVVTVLTFSFAVFAVLVVIGAAGYSLAANGGDWSFVLSVVVLALLFGVAVIERRFRHTVTRNERPIADYDQGMLAAAGLERLAARYDLAGLGMYVTEMDGFPATNPASRHGVPTACAVGVGANRRVVLTEALLRERRRVREFVVAHELTHLARRHLLVQSAASAAVYLLAVQLLRGLAESGRPWMWVGLSPTDPLAMPMVALVLFGSAGVVSPVLAWLTRAQERVADAGAIAVLGPLPADEALRLHTNNAADLDPPWWIRLFDQHPAPAERLEFLARHR